jgi:hypothetical protein
MYVTRLLSCFERWRPLMTRRPVAANSASNEVDVFSSGQFQTLSNDQIALC